jgi:hypothetical protein
VNTALALKADIIYVDSEISDLEDEIALKANITDVNTALSAKQNNINRTVKTDTTSTSTTAQTDTGSQNLVLPVNMNVTTITGTSTLPAIGIWSISGLCQNILNLIKYLFDNKQNTISGTSGRVVTYTSTAGTMGSLVVDTVVTKDSSNLITSGAVQTAITNAMGDINSVLDNINGEVI